MKLLEKNSDYYVFAFHFVSMKLTDFPNEVLKNRSLC